MGDIEALFPPRCLFCDSTDVTDIETADGGVSISFKVCRAHYTGTQDTLLAMPFGWSSSKNIWAAREPDCDHDWTEVALPPIGQIRGFGWRCSRCGSQTATTEDARPADEETATALRAIFGRWASEHFA